MDAQLPNIKKWIVMYPVYINSKKTMAEGRRIAVAKACENPTCAEIGDCCSYLKLPFAIEIDKAYPRDFMQRGRVRVLLKTEDGTLINPSISSHLAMVENGANSDLDASNVDILAKVGEDVSGAAPMDDLELEHVESNHRINMWGGKQLMLRVAEMVPRHHGRTKKQETASTSTTGPSQKSGKGGKKRR
ncbi:Signal recognition particle protein [Vigna angularis]|uniref:Signal recognition particle 19 kDa protein n=1 Tax=Phaseolus angularis TaxID=3914 RepID=A0A8T0JYN8_PHAAN|nr:Signal recognition particle protein [Vigna angularis]